MDDRIIDGSMSLVFFLLYTQNSIPFLNYHLSCLLFIIDRGKSSFYLYFTRFKTIKLRLKLNRATVEIFTARKYMGFDKAGSVQYCRIYQLPLFRENGVMKFGRGWRIMKLQHNFNLITQILEQTVGLQHTCKEDFIF